jgi:hypothetical protein
MVEHGDALTILTVEVNVQGYSQMFASPQRMVDQAQRDVLQGPAEDLLGGCGADGVAADSRSVYLAPGLLVDGVVDGKKQGF